MEICNCICSTALISAQVGTYDDDGNGTIEGSEFYRHFVKWRAVWKSTSEFGYAIVQTQLRRKYRVDGAPEI